MKILSIDTATSVCSVAVLEDKEVIKEISIDDEKTHSQKLMPLIEQVLKETNLKLEDIELLACDKGPRFFYWDSYWNLNYKSIF